MNNFSLEIVWRDDWEDLLELKVETITEFVKIHQYCYLSSKNLLANMNAIINHIENNSDMTEIIFGQMSGNFTPSFSMMFYPKKYNDDIQVELDLEINDNTERKHRCQLYLNSKAEFWKLFATNVQKMFMNDVPSQIVTLR